MATGLSSICVLSLPLWSAPGKVTTAHPTPGFCEVSIPRCRHHLSGVSTTCTTDLHCTLKQQVMGELVTQIQKTQATLEERSRKSEAMAAKVDEVSGESMNARSRLDGMERKIGTGDSTLPEFLKRGASDSWSTSRRY